MRRVIRLRSLSLNPLTKWNLIGSSFRFFSNSIKVESQKHIDVKVDSEISKEKVWREEADMVKLKIYENNIIFEDPSGKERILFENIHDLPVLKKDVILNHECKDVVITNHIVKFCHEQQSYKHQSLANFLGTSMLIIMYGVLGFTMLVMLFSCPILVCVLAMMIVI
jgi:hypothetical protein